MWEGSRFTIIFYLSSKFYLLEIELSGAGVYRLLLLWKNLTVLMLLMAAPLYAGITLLKRFHILLLTKLLEGANIIRG